MVPTVAMQLRDIAGSLRAMDEEGEFSCCKDFVRDDITHLPAALERLADQADAAARLAA
jgi:hypothetical protein